MFKEGAGARPLTTKPAALWWPSQPNHTCSTSRLGLGGKGTRKANPHQRHSKSWTEMRPLGEPRFAAVSYSRCGVSDGPMRTAGAPSGLATHLAFYKAPFSKETTLSPNRIAERVTDCAVLPQHHTVIGSPLSLTLIGWVKALKRYFNMCKFPTFT